jgi:hypothetical protein
MQSRGAGPYVPGVELRQAQGRVFSPQTGAPGDAKRQSGRSGSDGDSGEREGMKTLRSIADKIREKHPELGLSKGVAVALAIQTPAGAAAYLADKKARIRIA